MGARISVIVPTLGRGHLARTLRSVVEQEPYEVLVVADTSGDLNHVSRVCSYFGLDWGGVAHDENCKGGHTLRNRAMPVATGTHLAFMDDDDEYAPGALEAFKDRATDKPVIFRMEYQSGSGLPTLWSKPVLEFANVGTPMFLVPNDPERLGRWYPHVAGIGGDYTFISECAEKMGGVLWDERVVARVRPR